MAVDNNTIIEKAYLEGTNDFQQRVPDPTQSGIKSTIDALFDPMNKKYYNQFMDILINRVGFTYVRGMSWQNMLAPFKGNKLNYGSTIQEIVPAWIKAHSYEDSTETLLKLYRPEAATWYHSQNRRDQYPITINDTEMRTAFADEFGLNSLVAKMMTVPNNADNYDEYRIMLQLFAEYENTWGFFKYKLSAAPTNEDTGKEFLTAVKTFSKKLTFPSTLYNAVSLEDIPVFAKPEEMILIVTPETSASVDVNTLATLFHLDKADSPVPEIVVDELPIPNAVAILTTRDFLVCHDTLYNTTSFYNPQRLDTTYYLNHWGVYSVSPFVPAILFTTDTGTTVSVITQTVTGINVTMESATVDAGGTVGITIALEGTLSPTSDNLVIAPNSATYEVSAANSDGTAVKLDSRTYVDEYGVLHVAKSVATGTVITVTCKSTYTNPSGTTNAYSTTATVTVS